MSPCVLDSTIQENALASGALKDLYVVGVFKCRGILDPLLAQHLEPLMLMNLPHLN
jgi:hypothetical protein